MRYEDAAPWDQTRARPQVADDYAPASLGASRIAGEASPWYVGERYIADAGLAALERKRQQERATREASRRATVAGRA